MPPWGGSNRNKKRCLWRLSFVKFYISHYPIDHYSARCNRKSCQGCLLIPRNPSSITQAALDSPQLTTQLYDICRQNNKHCTGTILQTDSCGCPAPPPYLRPWQELPSPRLSPRRRRQTRPPLRSCQIPRQRQCTSTCSFPDLLSWKK